MNPDLPSVGVALHGAVARLRAAAHDAPRLASEVVLARSLGMSRTAMLARSERRLSSSEARSFSAAIDRLACGEPLAYVTGTAHFHGLELSVDHSTLIPRPETERLVDWGLQRIAARRGRSPELAVRVLDVGTGSGAVALAVASECPAARIVGTDVSTDALRVARRNAERLGLAQQVRFLEADLLPVDPSPFHVVLANLPYVGLDEMDAIDPSVRRFEPPEALFADADGLGHIRRLVLALHRAIARPSDIGLEVGWRQADAVARLLRSSLPTADVRVLRDLAGHERIVVAENAQPGRRGGP